jgi:membrane fusion protein, copper/silver efflux system
MRTSSLLLATVALAAGLGGGYGIAHYAASTSDVAPAAVAAAPADPRGKILYYRNPMGLPDTSPVPKKDNMGMDYIAVYQNEAAEPESGLRISTAKLQKLGVKSEPAALRGMSRDVRAVGIIDTDERRISVIVPRFEGYIESLPVNETGRAVKKGEVLARVYSPAVALAEQEYALARKSSPDLAEDALGRLRNWGVPAGELAWLKAGGKPSQSLAITAPTDAVVLEKRALDGMRFMPGDTLYRLADLSSVWLFAEVFEQDLRRIRVDDAATATFAAMPGRSFAGKVSFVPPTLESATRTAKVRIELANPDGVLRPSLYGSVEIASPVGQAAVLAVPDSAVLDTGARQTVLIDRGEGRFEPRAVKLGARSDGYVEITEGLDAGDAVVTRANFLIDAESNLRAALQSFETPEIGAQPK